MLTYIHLGLERAASESVRDELIYTATNEIYPNQFRLISGTVRTDGYNIGCNKDNNVF